MVTAVTILLASGKTEDCWTQSHLEVSRETHPIARAEPNILPKFSWCDSIQSHLFSNCRYDSFVLVHVIQKSRNLS